MTAVVAILAWAVLLILGTPLLVLARITAGIAWLPTTVRSTSRLVLLVGAYIALYEIGALGGHGLRQVSRWFFSYGLAFAGMRLRCHRPPPPISDRPVVVIARHAGMFNSPLVLALLATELDHVPHAIAKRTSAPTPGMRRIYRANGVKFFNFDATGTVAALRHLRLCAQAALPTDGFFVFPEGANYTAARRQQAIAELRGAGKDALADRAEHMRHLMHPHPGAARVLVRNMPDADVLIFAHTGLEDVLACSGLIDYPITTDGTVHTAWWHVPAAEVPRDNEQFEHWLNERWKEADAWIGTVRKPKEGFSYDYVSVQTGQS